MKPRALFIGRFSPFHLGHDAIIRRVLDDGEPVLVAVFERPLSASDPWTAEERAAMIREHYADEDVVVITIPNISSVNVGRTVGYDIRTIDVPEVETISGTSIRDAMRRGDSSWRGDVPASVANWIDK